MVPTVASSIVVIGVLTCCVLLYCVIWKPHRWTYKTVMNNIICELILYKFKLDHNTTEATENISYMKGESAFDHNTVTRFENFCLGYKNCHEQTSSGKS